MGSPARRLLNPITRCWDNARNRYAGTDDGRGTGQNLTQTTHADESALRPSVGGAQTYVLAACLFGRGGIANGGELLIIARIAAVRWEACRAAVVRSVHTDAFDLYGSSVRVHGYEGCARGIPRLAWSSPRPAPPAPATHGGPNRRSTLGCHISGLTSRPNREPCPPIYAGLRTPPWRTG